MGIGYVPGAFNINCAEGCESLRHALVEVDYENRPYIWGVAVEEPHDVVLQQLRPRVDRYLSDVDQESTFFLLPEILYSVSAEATALAIEKDISNFMEELDETGE